MADKIELSKVIKNVTDELRKAKKESLDPIMQFAECELEFAVEFEKTGEAGVNVWVFEIGGSVSKTQANTVKIKFKDIPANPIQLPQSGGFDKPGPEPGHKKTE